MERLIGLFNRLINVEYDLTTLIGKVKSVLSSIFTADGSSTKGLIDMVKAMAGAFIAYLPMVLLALCAIELLFGKKLFGIQKFLGCFLAGYVFGVYFLADIVASFVTIQDYIVGAVLGLICAILCKIFYLIGYVGVFGYLTYMLCFLGAIPVVGAYTVNNLMFSAAAAVVVVIIALIFRKFIEMLGTAALGAYGIVSIVDKNFFDLGTLPLGLQESTLKLAAIGVIALIGFIVQFKTRKRY